MLLGCGCGGVLELFFLFLMGGVTFGTLVAAVRVRVAGFFRH